ncbi:MAG: hypothetical protein AVDCRST_MAG40-2646, partial [uncultured Gemmatimonadaceae bacterium]
GARQVGDAAPPPPVQGPDARPDGWAGAPADPGNAPYDGRFTFARVRFTPMGGGLGFWGREDRKWDHDFPRAERNFARILAEVTAVRPYMDGGNVLALDDPELFKHPLVYLCEPGFWAPNDAEAAALGAYLAKGGFIIFDDFFGHHWDNFAASMRRVLPEGRLVRLDASHPIFDSFYHIESLTMESYGRREPEFWGIYEDNDPAKRLLAVANYNNDIGEDWEWSDAGTIPVDVSNQAYKLGVNYLMYAMTR